MQPGALVRHRYRALIPDGRPVADWTAGLEAAFPDGGWRLRDVRDSNPSLRRQLDRVGLFLTLAGLAALLVGGIGVASAVSSHLHGKLHTIAALKCVGATRATVQRAFLLQIGALGLAAIAAGLVIGAAAPPILAALLGDALPVPLAGVIHGAPLGLAAAYGALTMLAFSLWPLGRAARPGPACCSGVPPRRPRAGRPWQRLPARCSRPAHSPASRSPPRRAPVSPWGSSSARRQRSQSSGRRPPWWSSWRGGFARGGCPRSGWASPIWGVLGHLPSRSRCRSARARCAGGDRAGGRQSRRADQRAA